MPVKNSRKVSIDKRCFHCGEPLTQGDNEQARDWIARKSCNRSCHSARNSMRPMWEKFAANTVAAPSGCIEWTGQIDACGYGRIETANEVLAHRISYLMSFGSIPSGMCVCHRCDNRRCVKPSHLFLGTHKDNSDDKIRKGRLPDMSGVKNSNWRHGRYVREARNGH